MAFDDDNGILAKIRGEYIAMAMCDLPPAAAGQPETVIAEIDVPDIGCVRITYELTVSRHGRSKHWFWTGCFAEVVA